MYEATYNCLIDQCRHLISVDLLYYYTHLFVEIFYIGQFAVTWSDLCVLQSGSISRPNSIGQWSDSTHLGAIAKSVIKL